MADLRGLKAVITAGGIGTRLLPFSKEIPKEMAPILCKSSVGAASVKPIIQAIFEELYGSQIRDFFVIVGREKRAIEDHFTPDQSFIELLLRKGKNPGELVSFYDKMRSSNLVFVNQPEPLGFGDAVLKASPYIDGTFLVHAGDTYVISKDSNYLERLKAAFDDYDADASILLQDVASPEQYGVVLGEEVPGGVVKVSKAVEKPSEFVSKTAIMPVYIFTKAIFDALKRTRMGKNAELQLTDAIQLMISEGRKVVGVKLGAGDVRLDIGTPETLMEALSLSSKFSGKD